MSQQIDLLLVSSEGFSVPSRPSEEVSSERDAFREGGVWVGRESGGGQDDEVRGESETEGEEGEEAGWERGGGRGDEDDDGSKGGRGGSERSESWVVDGEGLRGVVGDVFAAEAQKRRKSGRARLRRKRVEPFDEPSNRIPTPSRSQDQHSPLTPLLKESYPDEET